MQVTIKKAHHGELRQVLGALRLAILDNRSKAIIPKKKFVYSPILDLLCNGGFIEGYEERGELVIINLRQFYWKSFQQSARAFTNINPVRLNRKSTVTSKQFIKAQYRTGQAVSFAATTDKGILSGLSASAKKIGGIPLFRIS